jgi:hypothetical protein
MLSFFFSELWGEGGCGRENQKNQFRFSDLSASPLMASVAHAEICSMEEKSFVFGNITNRGTISSSSPSSLYRRKTKSLNSVRGHSMQEEVMLQEKAISETHQNRDKDEKLTQDLIGKLFCSEVTQFIRLDHLRLSSH